MVVGAGIFNIPQNMAAGAGLGAVMASWIITAIGMLFLVYTFKILSDRHPELNAGIYEYAYNGFGSFAGFNIAWGYWLCTAFSNIPFAIMLNDCVGAFYPQLLRHDWHTFIFCSVLIWCVFGIVTLGMKSSKIITSILSGVKILMILLIIILLGVNLKYGFFDIDLSGISSGLGSFGTQVENSMMVTLWCFIGIEGAVVMSGRAKRSKDVGKAGIAGFLTAWILYFLISIFSFGVMSRIDLANLEDPSVAYMMRAVVGEWAYWLVIASVIVSLTGGWLAWTLVTAEVPYCASKAGILPRRFMRTNNQGVPLFGLLLSSIAMQTFLGIVMLFDDIYLTALSIVGMMILPAYLTSAIYLVKISFKKGGIRYKNSRDEIFTKIIGIVTMVFCIWMIYAGNVTILLKTSIFYLSGIGFYLKARNEKNPHGETFSLRGKMILCVLLLALVWSILDISGIW